MSKTPVSLLQEIAVRKRFSLPVYEFEQCGIPPTFTCVVKMGPCYEATALAPNKKVAKHEAAANLLRSLGVDLTPQPQTKVMKLAPPQESPSPQILNLNYIGLLNEWAAQKRCSAPDYSEDTTELNGFTIVCQFLERSSSGRGTTKKAAKQEAAKNMFELIKNLDIADLPQKTNQVFSEPSFITEALQKYNELVDNFKHMKLAHNDNNSDASESSVRASAITNWSELKDFIRQQGWDSSSATLQNQPLIISLNINEHKFLASGESLDVARKKLLVMVVDLLSDGFDFSKPVFE